MRYLAFYPHTDTGTMQNDIFFNQEKSGKYLKHLNITKSKMAEVSDKGIFCNKICPK